MYHIKKGPLSYAPFNSLNTYGHLLRMLDP